MHVMVRVVASMSRAAAQELTFPGQGAVFLGTVLAEFLATGAADRQVQGSEGDLRADVRVFVDNEFVPRSRYHVQMVPAGSEVWLMPAASGG